MLRYDVKWPVVVHITKLILGATQRTRVMLICSRRLQPDADIAEAVRTWQSLCSLQILMADTTSKNSCYRFIGFRHFRSE